MQNQSGQGFFERHTWLVKNEDTWCKALGYILRYRINSALRVFEGWWQRRRFMHYRLGRRSQPVQRGTQWQWPVAQHELWQPWQHLEWELSLRVRPPAQLSLFLRFKKAEFYLTDFIQPPNIFPTSSNFSERLIYFLSSKDFISQAICKKNLSKSNLTEARLRKISFSALSEYPAFMVFSITSKNKASIFVPSVCLESLEKLGKISCHSL